MVVVVLQGHTDFSSLVSIFEGIVDQVVDHHTDFLCIAPHHHALSRFFKHKGDVSLFGQHLVFLHEHLDDAVHVNQRHMQFHLAVLYLAEIKYLVDQLQHLVGIAVNEVEVFLARIGELFGGFQFLYGALDERQRCAQLMTHIGEETYLEFGQTVVDIHLVAHPHRIEQQTQGTIQDKEE